MKRILFILPLLLILFSCHEDLITEVTTTDEIDTFTIYEVGIEGLVSDPAGQPISTATLSIGDVEVSVDAQGHYIIGTMQLSGNRHYLSASAPGYISTGKTMTISASGDINVNIIMTPLADGSSFSSSNGGEISASNNATITFQTNSITQNNQPYIGNVIVSTYALEADYDYLLRDMPGALIGLDQHSEYKILQTYGMIYATLTDDQGQKVEIDPNAPATISIKVPSDMLANAPNEMPLWHFDEERGYWKEEGKAVLNRDRYEGEVSHFSWWNIDFPVADVVDVCLTIKENINNAPLANQFILFSTVEVPFGVAITNDAGEICVSLPKDEEVFINYGAECSLNQSGQSIGFFSESITNKEVTLNIANEGTTISGVVSPCMGENLEANFGILKLDTDRIIFPIDDEGSYSYSLLCPHVGESAVVLVADPSNGLTDQKEILIDGSTTEIEANLSLCDAIGSNTFVLETGSESIILDVMRVIINPNETILEMSDLSIFSFTGTDVGTHEGLYFRGLATTPIENMVVVVTSYGNTISGSISGPGITGAFNADNN